MNFRLRITGAWCPHCKKWVEILNDSVNAWHCGKIIFRAQQPRRDFCVYGNSAVGSEPLPQSRTTLPECRWTAADFDSIARGNALLHDMAFFEPRKDKERPANNCDTTLEIDAGVVERACEAFYADESFKWGDFSSPGKKIAMERMAAALKAIR